jgi:glycerol-3-phosphate dehydrogenase
VRGVPQDLDRQSFDFLVVGGGIHGAALAREAALRGCSVLLAERDDFASGTSSRSSRLVHGGVRYLQQGHVSLVREALAERERLLRLAPHLVRPLPLLMPFHAGGGKPAWMLRLGLRLYQLLAGRSTLPGPRYCKPPECARLFPGIRMRGLRGGSLYWDARTQDARLTLAILEAAASAGAVLVNHLEVVDASADGVRLREGIGEREITVRVRTILNAAGPHADTVRARLRIDAPPLVRTSRGSHIVLAPRDTETAIGAFLPDGRIQFVIPHPDGTLCGTTDVDEVAGDEPPSVPQADVDYLLGALAHLLENPPSRADVRFA